MRQNREKWLEYEQMVFGASPQEEDPDRLAELYIHLTDDLAYARTFYPKSQTVRYLNGLAARTHLAIYKNKKEQKNRFWRFWAQELPRVYRASHKPMLYAFLVFTFSFLIGFLSTAQDDTFARVILGDAYVNRTIENIENGDPMAIYKSDGAFSMFTGIAFNNIYVSFLAFSLGFLFSIGTFWVLFQNGVMVGVFLAFFHTRGLTLEAWPVIYIHGTLELSAIVIAGAAGILMGNSMLFPGTFTRAQSLQRAAKHGIKIMVGLVPVFLLAAFLESYVTRLTDMPLWGKLVIIGLSLAFILGYYLVYPLVLERTFIKTNTPDHEYFSDQISQNA